MQGVEYKLFGLGIKSGRGLVEKEDLRVSYDGTGYCYTLPLPPGDLGAHLPYMGVIPVR
jgi:hypothetical protein